MVDYEKILGMAREIGFESSGKLDMSTLRFLPEVRDMCEVNTCGKYGKSWACPPGCGSLEEMQEKILKYKEGVLVQTVGQLEDSLDIEGMQEAAENQAKRIDQMWEALKADYPNVLVLGAGTCTRCKKCTYPDEPCRFPDKQISSMEASGLFVNEVCTQNGLKYNHGKDTICYTGCFLFS